MRGMRPCRAAMQGSHYPPLSPLLSAGAGIFLIPRNAPYWRRVSLLPPGHFKVASGRGVMGGGTTGVDATSGRREYQ